MADSFGLSPEEMAQAAQRVFQVEQDVEARIAQLRGQLSGISAMWQGQASTAFQQLMQRYEEAAKKITQALNQIGEGLDASQKSYVQQEEEAKSSLGQFGSILG